MAVSQRQKYQQFVREASTPVVQSEAHCPANPAPKGCLPYGMARVYHSPALMSTNGVASWRRNLTGVVLGCWDKEPSYSVYLQPSGMTFFDPRPKSYRLLQGGSGEWESSKAFLSVSILRGQYFHLTGPSLRSPVFQMELDYLTSRGKGLSQPYRMTSTRLAVSPELTAARGPGLVGGILRAISLGPLIDRRVANSNRAQFVAEVQEYLGFLFAEHGARIVPNDLDPPLIMDLAKVTIALDQFKIAVTQGRGEIGAFVAAEEAPAEWHELSRVLAAIDEAQSAQAPNDYYGLRALAGVLWNHLPRLKQAISSGLASVKPTLAESYRREESALGDLEERLNRGLYGAIDE